MSGRADEADEKKVNMSYEEIFLKYKLNGVGKDDYNRIIQIGENCFIDRGPRRLIDFGDGCYLYADFLEHCSEVEMAVYISGDVFEF